ncbi:MAG: hypothetical protein HY652_12655, partial [Acidobacteria bacterium]|nr:hypothetical protein [Acidobacteriota bacterium]
MQHVDQAVKQIAASREGSLKAQDSTKAEYLFQLGEAVRQLVDLMNRDIEAHGGGNPLFVLILRRLEQYDVHVEFSKERKAFFYDNWAFREYGKLAPKGARAAKAEFRLIEDAFYRLQEGDTAGLEKAIQRKEAFLSRFPRDRQALTVKFFLAVDHMQLGKWQQQKGLSQQAKENLARASLYCREIVKKYPGTNEALSAKDLLRMLGNS